MTFMLKELLQYVCKSDHRNIYFRYISILQETNYPILMSHKEHLFRILINTVWNHIRFSYDIIIKQSKHCLEKGHSYNDTNYVTED